MTKDKTTTIHLPSGPIIARLEDDLIHARGINYASAKRFQEPQPASWTEPKDCTEPATICPQFPSRLSVVIGDNLVGREQSEDCLHVTVSAPINGKTLPVMVFFHGGAYMNGGGDLEVYNGSLLARKGVVAVTVTYRLGHFGYLAIPGIAPPNLGLLDQIEALRWVQKNISTFGGDPNQVTVHGQSAGGDSIYCLLVCDQAQGLFHRAVLQSAPMGRLGFEGKRVEANKAMADHITNKLGSSVASISTQEYLNLFPEIMKIAMSVHPSLLTFAPTFGEYPLPPMSELKQRVQVAAKRVAIFIGYTADEGTAFNVMVPSLTAEQHTKALFQDDSERLHDEICEIAVSPVYQFEWFPEGNKWGAAHCIELPLLFGNVKAWRSAPMLEGCDLEEMNRTLGEQVRNLWVAFAKGSDLGGKRYIIDGDFRFES